MYYRKLSFTKHLLCCLGIVIGALFSSFCALAQNDKVTGLVLGDDQKPIVGVNVYIEGTTIGTVTNSDGFYEIEVVENSTALVFSFIGYETQTIQLNGQKTINVTLETDTKDLDEVLVIGYGTTKKSDLTGSVGSIKSEVIKNLPVVNVDQAMQGRMSGVTVVQNSGSPGSGIMVRIRGIGTTGTPDPLYVVDGTTVDNINFLNPNDIASIEVLKDAAAAAIYGAAAANGVILVTTKQGTDRGTIIEFSSSIGVQNFQNPYELTTSNENAILNVEAWDNALGRPHRSPYWDPETSAPRVYDTDGTDWQDEITQNAIIQNYHLGIRGGSKNSTYNISFGYDTQDGVIKNSGYEKITGRINLNNKLSDYLTFGTNLTFTNTKRSIIAESDEYGPISNAMLMDRATPVYDTDDEDHIWQSGPTVIFNPVAQLELTNDDDLSNNLFGNLFLEAEVLKGLKFKSIFGVDLNYSDRITYLPTYKMDRADQRRDKSELYHGFSKSQNLSSENTLTYTNSFKNHNLTALVGFSASHYKWSYNRGVGVDTPSNDLTDRHFDSTDPTLSSITGRTGQGKGVSAFGRIIYSFNNKYLFTGTVRRDGSSKFGSSYRYGIFPSASVGWKISEENFMKSIEAINNLKLRLSWGKIGNNNIPDYAYTTLVTTDNYLSYTLGNTPAPFIGSAPLTAANPEIRWEESVQTNIGADLSLFENRITLTADYFRKNTKGMLLAVQVPAVVGLLKDPIQNAGDISNKGIELELSYRKMEGDFNYEISGNFTAIKNEVLDFGEDGAYEVSGFVQILGYTGRTEAGHPVGSFYGFKEEGIFQNWDEINTHAYQSTATAPGDVKFKDLNGDGVINDNDQTHIGSPFPAFTYGGNFACSYKNLDFSVFLQGSHGNEVYNVMEMLTSTNLYWYNKKVFDTRWTTENPSTEHPRVSSHDKNKNVRSSDRWVQDASYLRIKNIQLGYNIPISVNKNFFIKSCRFYVSAHNLLTFTKYSGLDPEVGLSNKDWGTSSIEIGVDRGNYPQTRIFTTGLNVTF